MFYYKRIFSLLLILSIGFALTIEVLLYWHHFSQSMTSFNHSIDTIIQQSKTSTDTILLTDRQWAYTICGSEYMYQYISRTPYQQYVKFKLFEFINAIQAVTSIPRVASAVTLLSDDFVFMNNYTSSISSFLKVFSLSEAQLETIKQYFSQYPLETTFFLSVPGHSENPRLVEVRCDRIQQAQPIFLFTLYTNSQLFNFKSPIDGTIYLFYNNQLISSCSTQTPSAVPYQETLNTSGKYIRKDILSSVTGYRYTFLFRKPRFLTSGTLLFGFIWLIILASVFLLMKHLTQWMYKPINTIITLIGKPEHEKDEIRHIKNTLISLYNNVDTMNHSIEEYNAIIENDYLRNLLTGYTKPEEMEKYFQKYKINNSGNCFSVILIKYGYSDEPGAGQQQNAVFFLKQNQAIIYKEIFSIFPFFRLIDINFETQALIIQCTDIRFLSDTLNSIFIRLETVFSLECYAAISKPVEYLQDIGDAYHNAEWLLEMIKYYKDYPRIISNTDLSTPHYTTAVYYPLHEEQALINAVLNGKTVVWKSILSNIIKNNAQKYEQNISQLSIMLCATLVRIAEENNSLQKDLFNYSQKNLFVLLVSCRNTIELEKIVTDIFEKLSEYILKAKEANSCHPLEEAMLSFIHKNYIKDISLNDLADSVSLTPSYVSAVFKNSTGNNFKAYLNRYRYEIACKIIQQNPQKKIRIVAAEVGCNTSILSRLFIQNAGIQPSDYQKQILANK